MHQLSSKPLPHHSWPPSIRRDERLPNFGVSRLRCLGVAFVFGRCQVAKENLLCLEAHVQAVAHAELSTPVR